MTEENGSPSTSQDGSRRDHQSTDGSKPSQQGRGRRRAGRTANRREQTENRSGQRRRRSGRRRQRSNAGRSNGPRSQDRQSAVDHANPRRFDGDSSGNPDRDSRTNSSSPGRGRRKGNNSRSRRGTGSQRRPETRAQPSRGRRDGHRDDAPRRERSARQSAAAAAGDVRKQKEAMQPDRDYVEPVQVFIHENVRRPSWRDYEDRMPLKRPVWFTRLESDSDFGG